MKPLIITLFFLLGVSGYADPKWETKEIEHVCIEFPTNSVTNFLNTPCATGPVQNMTKYSFRNDVLDLELVVLLFRPGVLGSLRGAEENVSAQIKAISGEETLLKWEPETVSDRTAGCLKTDPDRSHKARNVTLIDDTRTNNRLVIVDISYDADSREGKTDSDRIKKSVQLK